MYLIDTNVVSELRKPRPHGAVLAWIADADPALLAISAVTVGEIQVGIERLRTADPVRASAIEHWLQELASDFSVLPLDASIMRRWARLQTSRPGGDVFDALIAATALETGRTVVTRNIRDFEGFAVPLLNPFQS